MINEPVSIDGIYLRVSKQLRTLASERDLGDLYHALDELIYIIEEEALNGTVEINE